MEGTPDQDQYLTALQVAQEMGVSDQTVYNWIREKRLPATKIARPRQVYAGEEVRNFVPIADRGVRQLVNA